MSAPAAVPKCVIVGAGVIGITIAHRLSEAGVDVTVIDGGGLSAGVSGASFAQVNASYAGYWDYVALRQAGVVGYARMQRDPEGAPWFHNVGTVNIYRSGTPITGLDEHVSRLRNLGYPVDQIDVRPETLEPGLGHVDVDRVYRFAAEGYVDVPAMVADLAGRATTRGVRIQTGDPVVSVLTWGNDVTGVRLRSGETIQCDQLIVAAGQWTDEVLQLVGIETTYVARDAAAGTPVPGLLVVTEALDRPVRHVLSVDDITYRPHGRNQMMVWSGTVDGQLLEQGGVNAEKGISRQLGEDLKSDAAEFFPELKRVRVHEAVVTARAMPRDGLPIVGSPSGIHGCYVVMAHAGVTLAPALADLAVEEIVHGRASVALERFRPTRFSASAVPAV